MSDVICEQLAKQAGFKLSVGNWIAPDGTLIIGKTHESHHIETMVKYTKEECPEDKNHLTWMNSKVAEGFIRLVFRADILFQVGCKRKKDIWSKQPNYRCMIDILKKLNTIEAHIFSKSFYIIGQSRFIVNKEMKKLEIKEYENIS